MLNLFHGALALVALAVPATAAPLALQEAPHDESERAVAAQLTALSAALAAGLVDDAALAPFAADELAFDPLALEPEDASAPLVLHLDASPPAQQPPPRPRAEFAAELARWLAPFEQSREVELELVAQLDPGTSLVRARARGLAGGLRQQERALWRCEWALDAGAAPRLRALRCLRRERLRAAPGAPVFVDAAASALDSGGVYERQLLPSLPWWQQRVDAQLGISYLGHQGLALGDVDGDGLEDLYLCQPGGLPNLLFLKQPDGTAREVGAEAGVDFLDPTASALLLDLDGDGDRDLAAHVGEELLLLSNEGEARFARRGLFAAPMTMSMCAADVDGDGDLDLYLCGYVSPYSNQSTPLPYHVAENGAPNRLLLNLGGFRFRDATAALGLDENNRRFSFAAAFEDFDDDGDPDLYVSNDFGRNNLYLNEGGRFRDVAAEAGVLDVAAGMGVSWGDYDRDGRFDLYVSNMHSAAGGRMTMGPLFQAEAGAEERGWFRRHARGNSLYRNLGGGRFEDVSAAQGVTEGGWTWGAIFTDYQNDGRLDLFVPNGMATNELEEDLEAPFWAQVIAASPTGGDEDPQAREDYMSAWRRINSLMRQGWSWHGREPYAAFVQGEQGFLDAAWAFGLALPEDGRAAARVDWDLDGDLDLIVTSRTGPRVRLLLNQLAPGDDFVALRPLGTGSNTDAIGARVELLQRGGTPGRGVASVRAGEGFLAQQSAWLHFGLGGGAPEAALVRWPDGTKERFEGLDRGAFFELRQGSGAAERWTPPAVASALVPGELPPPDESSARLVPAWPLPVPTVPATTAAGEERALFGVRPSGQERRVAPRLVLVGDPREPRVQGALATLGSKGAELAEAGVLRLALGTGDDREAQLAALEALGWSGETAFVDAPALRVLDVLHGALTDRETPLPLPSVLLFDGREHVVALYAGLPRGETLLADLALLEDLPSDERRRRASPVPGRWNAPVSAAPLGYYQSRYEALGLPGSAREYMLGAIEVVQVDPAEAELQRGRALARARRFADAEAAFRAALELAPERFDAASGLAVVLHSQRRYADARGAYERALELAPDHADTLFNLALVSLALDDRARAVQLRERLQTLAPQLLPQLDRALAAHDARADKR